MSNNEIYYFPTYFSYTEAYEVQKKKQSAETRLWNYHNKLLKLATNNHCYQTNENKCETHSWENTLEKNRSTGELC